MISVADPTAASRQGLLILASGVSVPIFRRPDVHADQPAHFIVGRAEVCWRFETFDGSYPFDQSQFHRLTACEAADYRCLGRGLGYIGGYRPADAINALRR
jgi:hypothetical protein